MREGRITRHYGFGVARIGLAPEPYLGEPDTGFVDGVARALRQRGQTRGGLFKDLVNLAPAAVLGLILLLAFVLTFAQSRRDDPQVDLVLLASQTLPLEEVPPIPELPVAEPPRPEPPPVVPEPPAPKPPPQATKPPPRVKPPPPKARPKPPPALAAPQPPKQAPPARPRAAPRPERAPATRPKPPVAVPTLAAAPQAAAHARPSRTRPNAASPERNAPPPPGLSAPQVQPDFQVARAPSRGARPTRPLPASPARQLAPPVAHAAAPVVESTGTTRATSQRMGRTAPAAKPSERPRPQLAGPSAAPAAAPASSSQRLARANAPTPSQPPAKGRSEDPRLAGVPLASLASCVTDREEDGLKRRVIAAVGSRSECASPDGRYRFVETKNLNAFLMWVERSSSRAKADRCAELSLALECLEQRRARGGRGSRG